MYYRIATLILSGMLLTGCQELTRQQTGAVIGGVAGGVLGNQIGHGSGRTAAVIGGTLVGALVGGAIGRNMDENDRHHAQQALEYTPTHESTSWRNPDTGNAYTVTPIKTYETAEGPCREYETDATIDGRHEVVTGRACRNADGSWRTVN
jgi:surface antigen